MSIHRLFQCGLKSPKYSNHRQKAIPYIAVFQSLRSLRTATPSGPTPPGTAAYFNPRGPCGPQLPSVPSSFLRGEFQSLRSLRTATPSRLAEARAAAGISILAVLADRNHCVRPSATLTANFNRCGPCGPRPDSFTALSLHQSYFNPCGPCGPRPWAVPSRWTVCSNFNPRGPCGPRPLKASSDIGLKFAFQSSRSLRTATTVSNVGIGLHGNFNPRGPCGPRLGLWVPLILILGISILAVLADRDGFALSLVCWYWYFNPRGPCGPRLIRSLLICRKK